MSLPSEAAPYLDEWLGPHWTAQPLAGDASVRAYYRVTAADKASIWIDTSPQMHIGHP